MKRYDPDEVLKSRVTLFIEWLRHEAGLSYADMARKTGVAVQHIAGHEFSAKRAYKIAMAFKSRIADFDRYYGWEK